MLKLIDGHFCDLGLIVKRLISRMASISEVTDIVHVHSITNIIAESNAMHIGTSVIRSGRAQTVRKQTEANAMAEFIGLKVFFDVWQIMTCRHCKIEMNPKSQVCTQKKVRS